MISMRMWQRDTNLLSRAQRCQSDIYRDKEMSKEQKSNKETKKKPAMTAKEKKAAKKAKKNDKGRMGE